MSLSDIFGGSGGTTQVPVSTSTTIQLPERVEASSKQLYESSVPLAERDYPQYPTSERIAPLNVDQLGSFQAIRDAMGVSQPTLEKGLSQVEQSATPIGTGDIDRFMNPYIQNVIDASVAQITNQAGRDRITRNAALANRGSFLNEDRRGIIDAVASEGTNRTIAEMVSNLMAGGYSQALQQANLERGRSQEAANLYGRYAPLQQQTAYADAAALGEVGAQRQGQEQALRSLTYDDFMKNFYYPQDQANWLLGILSGTPYGQTSTTTGTQNVGTANQAGSTIGGLASLAGTIGDFFG